MKRVTVFGGASVMLAATLLAAACEDVPSLRFVADGGSDSGTKSDAADAQAKLDGGEDAEAPTCPTAPPTKPLAEGCCNDVPCVGGRNCSQLCAQKGCGSCVSGEYCCTAGSGSCIPAGDPCQ
jgi:hypothetical protein